VLALTDVCGTGIGEIPEFGVLVEVAKGAGDARDLSWGIDSGFVTKRTSFSVTYMRARKKYLVEIITLWDR
jgi:hypothetical protein